MLAAWAAKSTSIKFVALEVFKLHKYSSICHTQLQEILGLRGKDKFLPHCLGHEATGVVVNIGKGVKKPSDDKWKVGTIERMQFYKEAKEAFVIVSTTDARAFGCFILTKGVIKPDGSVW